MTPWHRSSIIVSFLKRPFGIRMKLEIDKGELNKRVWLKNRFILETSSWYKNKWMKLEIGKSELNKRVGFKKSRK